MDNFFNAKYFEYSRRLQHIIDRYSSQLKLKTLDSDELDDLVGILIESRSQLRKLQWYSEVNKRGFVKILKKFDKKIGVKTQKNYLTSKIYVLPFANGSNILEKLNIIKNVLSELAPDVTRLNLEEQHASEDNPFSYELRRTSTDTSAGSSFSDSVTTELKAMVVSNQPDKLADFFSKSSNPVSSKAVLPALSRAVAVKSFECIDILLAHVSSLEEPWDVNGRNLIHRFIINNSRQGAATPSTENFDKNYLNPAEIPRSVSFSTFNGRDGANLKDQTDVLEYLLAHLTPTQCPALVAKDENKRTPLHYACKYGLVSVVKIILKYLQEWNYLGVDGDITLPVWQDAEGETPLDLAVNGVHPKTARVLFETGRILNPKGDHLSHILSTAARIGSIELLDVLLSFGLDINQREKETLETPLFIACHLNHQDVVQYLLSRKADLEIPEATYGWTPIFAAAVDGLAEVAKLLKEAGCDLQRQDESGWTAMEHACLRGHIDLAEYLKPLYPPGWTPAFGDLEGATSGGEQQSGSAPMSTVALSSPSPGSSTVSVVSDSALSTPVGAKIVRPPSPELIKSFGHGYLRNKSMVLLTLGNTDTRWKGKPIELEKVTKSNFHSTQLDTALSLIISMTHSSDEPVVLDLPLSEESHAEQIPFYVEDANDVKVYFDLVPTYSANRKLVGRAVALIPTIRSSIGQRQNLNSLLTLPIIEVNTLEVLGTVSFGVLVITPFSHPNMGIEKSATYWKSLITTRVIGHRGLGKNTTKKSSLQLGENTLESFVQASNLGASYVEFDVQITKDHVPVIYHDFLVGETGIDVPMESLTLEQFLSMSKPKDFVTSRPSSPGVVGGGPRPARRSSGEPRPRSKSVYAGTEDEYEQMTERIKYTRDFKLKGFKGNFRGHSIQSPFTTLEKALKTVPKHVGFNVECKYPMLDESEQQDMERFALELNTWIEVVLKCIYDHGQGRDIIFSSFNPDVCIMLSLKQPSIPVLFLTEGGTAKMADVRASSLREAIRFAKKWNLLGIVSECTPLILCPRLVSVVKKSGLVCVTYGMGNNDPGNARIQLKYGVDAVIVDSVLAIRKGLTSGEVEEEEEVAVAAA